MPERGSSLLSKQTALTTAPGPPGSSLPGSNLGHAGCFTLCTYSYAAYTSSPLIFRAMIFYVTNNNPRRLSYVHLRHFTNLCSFTTGQPATIIPRPARNNPARLSYLHFTPFYNLMLIFSKKIRGIPKY